MTSPAPSLFSSVEMAPKDPILGLTETFLADQRPEKVNLGVGVYYDDQGKLPLLRAVKRAEEARVAKGLPRGYQPIDGPAAYNKAVQALLFDSDSPVVTSGRVVTIDALGGTGGLRVGAEYLRRLCPDSRVAISDPTWENHRGVFESAGFTVQSYTYYDPQSHGLDFGGMVQSLKVMPQRTIVLLHACCHNPTGVDLNLQQWEEVVALCKAKQFIPFLDLAYQGFGDGIDQDAAAVRLFVQSDMPFLVASSFSKSFSLYGERVGALSLITADANEAARVLSQIKRVIRTNYSNPPIHGGGIVSDVLNSPELRALWEQELGEMRDRIRQMRAAFTEKLKALGTKQDFSFVTKQRGMFSFSGLSAQQVDRLREEHAIYAISTGRICVAALNSNNIDRVVRAVASVL
ncbi:MAG: aspartate/tyrosine/aromatic aminotransferase [Betaproteobacteria bacterium]|nr:aspartate/tyrosine/aromatic aminotransferase [Betaproteobacteria bacterium]